MPPTTEFQKTDGSIEFGSSPTEKPPGVAGGVTRAITEWYRINGKEKDGDWIQMSWGKHRLKMMAMEAKTIQEFQDNLKKLEEEVNAMAYEDEKSGILHLLNVLADIREAVGDPQGRLMQDELIEHCKALKHTAEFNKHRVAMLSRLQHHMRDPERTLVCDVLANGQLLPDPDGKRYGFKTTEREHHASK